MLTSEGLLMGDRHVQAKHLHDTAMLESTPRKASIAVLTSEGLLIGGGHVQAKHFHHAAAHEVDVGHTGSIHKLGVLHKGAVDPLQYKAEKHVFTMQLGQVNKPKLGGIQPEMHVYTDMHVQTGMHI